MSSPASDDAAHTPHPLMPLLKVLSEPCAITDRAGIVCGINAAWEDLFVTTGLGGPWPRHWYACFNGSLDHGR
ncbi:MAG: hypothetical protein AB4911_05120 [Oscillochloridaceae bacterium umkhey_bin13]